MSSKALPSDIDATIRAFKERRKRLIEKALKAMCLDDVRELVCEMERHMSEATSDRTTWRIGERVVRINSSEFGTVVLEGSLLKVKWDDGSTSYYKAKRPVNVRLAPKT